MARLDEVLAQSEPVAVAAPQSIVVPPRRVLPSLLTAVVAEPEPEPAPEPVRRRPRAVSPRPIVVAEPIYVWPNDPEPEPLVAGEPDGGTSADQEATILAENADAAPSRRQRWMPANGRTVLRAGERWKRRLPKACW